MNPSVATGVGHGCALKITLQFPVFCPGGASLKRSG